MGISYLKRSYIKCDTSILNSISGAQYKYDTDNTDTVDALSQAKHVEGV
jgi:hypothetical protein